MLATAPGPIAHINIDLGTDDVEEKMILQFKRDDIIYKDIRMPSVKEADARKMAIAAWDEIFYAIDGVCKRGVVRTVCTDTTDAIWRILRLSLFGKLEKVPQQMYDQANLMMSNLLMTPQNHGINMIAAHRLKQVWEDTEYKTKEGEIKSRRAWTGEYERDGFGHTSHIFRVNIRHMSRMNGSTGMEFGYRILDCTANPDLAGVECWGSEATYQMLGMLAYDGSKAEDWL
jgi:hypothetical protein